MPLYPPALVYVQLMREAKSRVTLDATPDTECVADSNSVGPCLHSCKHHCTALLVEMVVSMSWVVYPTRLHIWLAHSVTCLAPSCSALRWCVVQDGGV